MKENIFFVHIWDYRDDTFDHWKPYDLDHRQAALEHIERWKDSHPSRDGELLEAFLSEA